MLDFHCHSTCSDGTLSPSALAERGRGFAAFALTDHDTCDGCAAFLAACRSQGGLRLAGVELSVEPGEGFGEFHLLGLGVDPSSARLGAFLDGIRAEREERNRKITARLAALGMPFDADELRRHAGGRVVARPHFARVLVAHGWARDGADAFNRFLAVGRPGYVPRAQPAPEAAIGVVHAAGGLAVMAHPRYWTQDAARLREGLRLLKDAGLDGVEAIYGRNTIDETRAHLRLARELDLLVTAGSDFHGENRPDVPLGLTVEDEAALVEAVRARLRPPSAPDASAE